jgi:hypothetical protein
MGVDLKSILLSNIDNEKKNVFLLKNNCRIAEKKPKKL